MPDNNKVHEEMATSRISVSSKDDNENDPEFVEVDPTGRYGRYNEILGKGAFKTVYRAFDEVDGIEVAWNQVKVQDFLQSPEDLERLYSEVHLLKTLKHKNIIKFYNSWIDIKTKNVNFITEIFTSGTLRQYRTKHKHVDLKAVKSWARQILRGLLYLHSHDPPIIHRDLKCDNIFVNGNQGEVKIGDLGLATILRQANAAHSVIGTPEFMAPELYEEEYNELVDIYSFGMCVLEMVTFEYPYSECTNAAQIYKKVTSGKKPAAFDKVKDPEVRSFVEKCLAAASRRLPARELLMDPFLHSEGDRESLDLLPPRRLQTHADDMEELGTLLEGHHRLNTIDESSSLVLGIPDRGRMFKGSLSSLNLTSSVDKDSKAEDEGAHNHSESLPSTKNFPFSSSRRSRDFKVKGKRREDDTIFLRLRIGDHEGHFRNIHFPFDIEADTALSVASEMVAELDLSDQDVTTIAEMIDAEILALVPNWKPGAAFDESVGIDGENSPDWFSEGLGTPQTDKNLFHSSLTDSFLESPSISAKPSYQSPSHFPDLTAASPAREHSIRRRFEEVSYLSGASDHSFQSEEFPDCSSDSSHAQEEEVEERLNRGFGNPGSPNSSAYGSSTEPSHSCALVQVDKGINHMDLQPRVAMDEPSNLGLRKALYKDSETAMLNTEQGDHELSMSVLGDKFESLDHPEFKEKLDGEAFFEHENDEIVSVSGVGLALDGVVEDSVAEELRTLALSQEQELKELQRKHELAVLEIQKRSRHKCGSFRLLASVERQERIAECLDNRSLLLKVGGKYEYLPNPAFGQDVLSKSYLSESEEPLEVIVRGNCVQKPDIVDISEEMEAGSCTQETVNSLKCTGMQFYLEMDQPLLRNESISDRKVKSDFEGALSASEHQHRIKSGCTHILLKDSSGGNLAHTDSLQLSKELLCKGIVGSCDEDPPMGVSMTVNSKSLPCDMDFLLGEPNHCTFAEVAAHKTTLEIEHSTDEKGFVVGVLSTLEDTHCDFGRESLVQSRDGSCAENCKPGDSQREKLFVVRGGFKGLDVPQDCEPNLEDASINKTEAGRFEQQKKEQLQKFIAEMEAKSLQGLYSSQTRYPVSCGKKNLGGPNYVGQTDPPKSQVQHQNAVERNTAW